MGSDRAAGAGGNKRPSLLKVLGPGLITGASDDDPSGIATYSQVGAQFGFLLGWTVVFIYPLMAAIQEISARLGRVTGRGIAGNICRYYPPAFLYLLVGPLLAANVINIAADVGAMGAAIRLVAGGGPAWAYILAVGLGSAALQVLLNFRHYVNWLKWLSLSLTAYVIGVFVLDIDWPQVVAGALIPRIPSESGAATSIVAVLGTTISPYLFFWQAQMEVEGNRIDPEGEPLRAAPQQAPAELARIRLDTYVGMAFSNLAALAIIITTGATLHRHGITDIQTGAQAAEALRPIAGDLSALVFALGIVGTGLMGVPVLAGSAAYALGEACHWPVGLDRLPREAKSFYLVIALATLLGVGIVFSPLDPFKALFWSAVINGVLAPPIMAMMMVMASRAKIMGRFRLPWPLRLAGWAATAVMAAAVAGMVL